MSYSEESLVQSFTRLEFARDACVFRLSVVHSQLATATYPEQIMALKNFLRQRAAWLDANLARVTP
jgi:hypothetical protein